MADGRGRHDWAQTSNILALIANANRDKKKHPRPFGPDDFDPHAAGNKRRGVAVTAENIGELRGHFEAMKKAGKADGK